MELGTILASEVAAVHALLDVGAPVDRQASCLGEKGIEHMPENDVRSRPRHFLERDAQRFGGGS